MLQNADLWFVRRFTFLWDNSAKQRARETMERFKSEHTDTLE